MKKIAILLSLCCICHCYISAQCTITHIAFESLVNLENTSELKLELFDDDGAKITSFLWEGSLKKNAKKAFAKIDIPVGGVTRYYWQLTEFDFFLDDDYGQTQMLHLNSSKQAVFFNENEEWKVEVRVSCE